MNAPTLYRGVWPQNVSKLAKYAVRLVDGEWKITVLYEAGEGLRYLAVEGDGKAIADGINALKTALQSKPGGAFYVNEYRHVIVPVSGSESGGAGSQYYFVGKMAGEFKFEYEGRPLLTRPIDSSGQTLKPGERWNGPRPGIPYVLAAGGDDIYYRTPALTEAEPPALIPNTTRQVKLSKLLNDKGALAAVTKPIAAVRGHLGGRFYVNEHRAIFTPVTADDGNGLDYIYCGQIDPAAWFPEPQVATHGSGS